MCPWTLEALTAGLNTEWFFLMQARAHFTRAWRRGSYLNLSGPETLGLAVDTPGEEKTRTAFGEDTGPASELLCFVAPLGELHRGFSGTPLCPFPLADPHPDPQTVSTSLFILASYSMLYPLGGRLVLPFHASP